MNEPEIEWIKRIDCRPGDTLVVKYKHSFSYDTAIRIKRTLEGNIPDGVKVLVLTDDAEITVLSPAA